ncbi:uncharacterized protein LOC141835361 [Curcuma longa]|uniref:uncharacterized protein LOC141835361 n=1 Tax=Curcuma longa TaxID=136217 RepID=UPI003D9F6F6C
MAKELEDAEFWLPAEILGGDDEPFLVKSASDGKAASFSAAGFPSELPFGFAANLDSPVESVTDEEEDYMAGLTKQMAHYFLQDDDEEAEVATGAAENSEAMAGSPQSTLCVWSASSNKGSPNGPSLVSSPPTLSPLEEREKAENPRDLLHEAAGQVMRLRLDELGRQGTLYERGILRAHMTSPIATAPTKVGTEFFAPNPVLSQQEIQTAHFYHLKRQQEIKQQLSAAAVWAKQTKVKSTSSGGRYGENLYCRPLDLPDSAWPPLGKSPAQQQQPPAFTGSGMRAVFLHTAAARKESAGTGVFLPRPTGNKFEPKKKKSVRTGCSTVLVPDRVVQALNLNLDEFAAQPRFPGGFVLSHDALIGRSSVVPSHQKKPHPKLSTLPPTGPAFPAAPAAVAHETGLPQEWTY